MKTIDYFDDSFDHLWLYRIDEKGRMIFYASGLQKLDVIWQVGKHNVIETKQIYKFPNLKQTGYEVVMPVRWIKFVGGEGFKSDSAIKVDEIKIKFPEKKEIGLTSYLNEKINNLNLMTIVQSKGIKDLIDFNKIKSSLLNKMLSVSCQHNNKLEFYGGIKNIFESDELLDQLLVTSLFINARWGDKKSHIILYTLIRDIVKKHSQEVLHKYGVSTNTNSEADIIDLENELLYLTSSIILGTSSKTYSFEQNNRYSFCYAIAGGLSDKKGGFHSLIKQYINNKYIRDGRVEKMRNVKISIDKEDDVDNLDKVYLTADSNNYSTNNSINLKMIFQQLNSQEQEIINLVSIQGLTYEDAGKKIGMEKSGAYKRYQKAIKKIKEIIEPK